MSSTRSTGGTPLLCEIKGRDGDRNLLVTQEAGVQ